MVGPKYFSLFLKVRSNYVVSSFLVISVIGSYGIRSNMTDVYLMLLLGLTGYVIQKVNIPLAPVVLGLILGPLAEKGLRHGIELGPLSGSVWSYFFLRPISIVIILLIVVFTAFPYLKFFKRRKKAPLPREKEECSPDVTANKRKPVDFILAGVIAISSIAGLSVVDEFTPGAKIFPIFCFSGFLLCAALLVIVNLFRSGWASADEDGWGGLPTIPWAKFLAVSALYVLFVAAMQWIGFTVSSLLFMLAVVYISDTERMYIKRPLNAAVKYAIFSLAATVVIYLVFIKTLNLTLPMHLMTNLFG
jgi:hypothetical protein